MLVELVASLSISVSRFERRLAELERRVANLERERPALGASAAAPKRPPGTPKMG